MSAIGMLAGAMVLAASIGRTVLTRLGTVADARLDRLVYSAALGLGVISYAVLVLGLLGMLAVGPVLAALAVLLVVSWRGLLHTLLDLQPRVRRGQALPPVELEWQRVDGSVPAEAVQGAPTPATRSGSADVRSRSMSPVPERPTADPLPRAPVATATGTAIEECAPDSPNACNGTSGDEPAMASLAATSTGHPAVGATTAKGRYRQLLLTAAVSVVIGALAIAAIVDCFVPPGAHEWDALSYHLAAPKVYLQHHRILFLPTDHHSNFPFLVEMLFTLGLMLNGYPLANLFHFAMGAVTVAGLVAIGRRHFARGVGPVAALAFATTPIAVWEAGAAYIELGLTLYALVAIGAALEYQRTRDGRWLALAGVLMGFALSVKALALVPFMLLALLLLVGRARWRDLRWYLAAAIAVGCPFYVKSAVYTGNPVYPFAYRVFGGKYWNQELADSYASTQQSFGFHDDLLTAQQDAQGVRPAGAGTSALNRIRNLLLAPFGLVAVPRIFYDYFDPGVFNQLGFLFLALPPLALVAGGLSAACRRTGGLAAAWYAAWALTMQYSRYAVPILPLIALVGAEGAVLFGRARRAVAIAAGAAIALQAGLVMSWFVARLFANPGGKPGQIEIAADPDTREQYLRHQINSYAAMEWINQNTPPAAGVVLFDEARGFYLDRRYLWGNTLHSTYIPYPTFATGREMVDWYMTHGIDYGLVNMRFSQEAASGDGSQRLRDAVATGTTELLFLEWYSPHTPGERFRRLIGDAVATGAARVVRDGSLDGSIVLEFVRGTAGASVVPTRIVEAPRPANPRASSRGRRA